MALWPCGFKAGFPCSLFPFVPFRLVRLVVLVCGLLFSLVIGLSLGLSLAFGLVFGLVPCVFVALWPCCLVALRLGFYVGAFELTKIGWERPMCVFLKSGCHFEQHMRQMRAA